jgi:hypothetical protein
MLYKNLLNKLATPLTFILIGVVARILPHPPNFAPIGAMALFGGTYMSKKQSLIVPLTAMIVSDLFIGFDSVEMRLTVYGTFLLIVGLGFVLKKHVNTKNAVFASLAASLLFFITTNFAVWAFGSMYSRTPGGLIECFTLAIPFLRSTVMGDIFYTGVFFGGFSLVSNLARKNNRIWNTSTGSG